MEKILIATGKNFDHAVEAALAQLGLDRDSVSIVMLQKERAGFLGFGAQPCKIQVTYELPDPEPAPQEKPKSALGSASRSRRTEKNLISVPEAPKPEEKKPEKKPEPKKTEARKPEAKKPEAKKPREPKAPRTETAPKEPKTYAPAEPGSVEERIEVFLKGLLEHMGSNAQPHAWKDGEDSYRVEFTGDDLGYLIGRRGDTLDALQHLANYTVNRGAEGRIRISVDAEDYRQKREESLRRYARKKAQQVLKNRRRTTLEPMNAYERHVVHAALQDVENVTTHSTGTEPNRRVVIEYIR